MNVRVRFTDRPGFALALLASIWTLNYFDRNVLNVLLQPIKAELHLSDTALGLMTGFAFTLFFSVISIPMARLADRSNRISVIGGGLAVWSVMTMLSGLCSNAVQLCVCRALVGIGEATGGGPSQALLSDIYPPRSRGKVMSALAMCTFVGILLAFTLGSVVNARLGWRATFFVAGIPGLFVALLTWTTLKDRPRGATETGKVDTSDASVFETLRFMLGQRSYVLIVLCFCSAMMCTSSLTVWAVAFLQRVHGLSNQAAGLAAGPVLGISGIVGALIGVTSISSLTRRDPRWEVWAPGIAMMASAPALLLYALADRTSLALAGLAFATMCSGFQPGPIISAVTSLSKVRARAVTAGFMLSAMNLVGWGLGPLLTGAVSDAMLGAVGERSLRYAMLLTPLFICTAGILALASASSLEAGRKRAIEGEI